jgi:hypothetical protein
VKEQPKEESKVRIENAVENYKIICKYPIFVMDEKKLEEFALKRDKQPKEMFIDIVAAQAKVSLTKLFSDIDLNSKYMVCIYKEIKKDVVQEESKQPVGEVKQAGEQTKSVNNKGNNTRK